MIIVGVPLLLGPVAGPLFDRAIVGSASWRSPSRHRCERRNALRSSSSAPKNQSRRVPLSRSATSSFLFERRETVSLAARWAGFVSVDRPGRPVARNGEAIDPFPTAQSGGPPTIPACPLLRVVAAIARSTGTHTRPRRVPPQEHQCHERLAPCAA